MVTHCGGFSSESVSDLPKKGICGNNRSSSTKAHVSKDSHGKISECSFVLISICSLHLIGVDDLYPLVQSSLESSHSGFQSFMLKFPKPQLWVH